MSDQREITFWSPAQAALFKVLGHRCRIELQQRETGALSPLFIFGPETLRDWQHLREEIQHLQRSVSDEIAKQRRAERSAQRPAVLRRQREGR